MTRKHAAPAFTPGPWMCGWYLGGAHYIQVATPDGSRGPHIADVYINAKANARLIASAPDLYALAQSVVDTIRPNDPMPAERALLAQARTALRRARGEGD